MTTSFLSKRRLAAIVAAFAALVCFSEGRADAEPGASDAQFCSDPESVCRRKELPPECDAALDAGSEQERPQACVAAAQRYVACLAPAMIVCLEQKRQVSLRCAAEARRQRGEPFGAEFGDALEVTLVDERLVHMWDLESGMDGQVTDESVIAHVSKDGAQYGLSIDRRTLAFTFTGFKRPHSFEVTGLCAPIPRRPVTRANLF